jgi:hypothetical protein
VFEAERAQPGADIAGRFDGFHAVPASVSKTCLVRFDNNKYSVSSSAVGRPVEIQAYADRIVIRQDGRLSASTRCFGRGREHLRSLALCPGAGPQAGRAAQRRAVQGLGAAGGLERVRRKLAGSNDGDRQMVAILTAVLPTACPPSRPPAAKRSREGVHSADVILNILARQRDPGPAVTS